MCPSLSRACALEQRTSSSARSAPGGSKMPCANFAARRDEGSAAMDELQLNCHGCTYVLYVFARMVPAQASATTCVQETCHVLALSSSSRRRVETESMCE